MYKLIIYCNDLELISKYYNNVFCDFNNIKLIGIATNEKDLTYLTKKTTNNLIILYDDTKDCNLHILDKIKNKIIICSNADNYKNSKNTMYISSNNNFIFIRNCIQKFISTTSEIHIRQKVYKILEKLNFDFKLNGTNYLLHAITYSYINKDDYLFENLEKKIYPYVAKKFNVSVSNIKWSIIRSINNMNSKKNSYINFSEKVTSKVLISEIVNRID